MSYNYPLFGKFLVIFGSVQVAGNYVPSCREAFRRRGLGRGENEAGDQRKGHQKGTPTSDADAPISF